MMGEADRPDDMNAPRLVPLSLQSASQPPILAPQPQPQPQPQPHQKKPVRCRYFITQTGCRAGNACPFIHDRSRLKTTDESPTPKKLDQQVKEDVISEQRLSSSYGGTGKDQDVLKGRRFVAPPVKRDQVVPKPIPRAQAENPREYQIQQLRRRFSPREISGNDGTSLAFRMVPSDPDFPFDMAGLDCVLHVPLAYPEGGRPSLEVKNRDMERGYQINVEHGFRRLAQKLSNATLLGLINALDKQLEPLLTEQKAETVKLIPNNVTRSMQKDNVAQLPQTIVETEGPKNVTEEQNYLQVYTHEQKKAAEARRAMETRQLEARLGRLPLFFKSSDGTAYTIPIEPRRPEDLPVPLQAIKAVKVFVPMLYPLEHCRIEVLGVTREAASNTEKGFEQKAQSSREMTLMSHINFLAQHMHDLAIEPPKQPAFEDEKNPEITPPVTRELQDNMKSLPKPFDDQDDRSHIKFVSRPPEWTLVGKDSEDDSEDSDPYNSEGVVADDTKSNTGASPEQATKGPEKGISLSFPSLELYGIEILELTSLCVTVKCERCKDTLDISNLHDITKADTRSISCKKCANSISIGYRKELMHVKSARAGYIDLDGCTVIDMLPSNFVPTCSECSTTYLSPGIVSVRGESSMAICRECHRKMSFKIPEVKFLIVSATAHRTSHAPVRKRPQEKLGIVAGQELPRRGRCNHYSKSYRWFRFSCCAKVFACDKCHDQETDHPNEHANRMICGFCSREQLYRPEDCLICHSILVGKCGTGFWEGGKGTRDRVRMSRKDPRKYKRPAGAKK